MVYVYKESIVGVEDAEWDELRIVDEDGELTFHFDRSTPCLQD